MTSRSFFQIFDTAFRSVVLIVSLALFVLTMAVGVRSALAASLKSSAVLTADVLTVGDIFENAGRNADYVLGPAPEPGKDMVLNTSTLMRIAMALDLPWQPTNTTDQIVIKRAYTTVSADAVTSALEDSLHEKVIDEKFVLDTGSINLSMILPYDAPATVDISNTSYNSRTGRFEATISAPSTQNPIKQKIITGTVRALTQVPVLKSALRNGDIIAQNDIEMIDVYTNELQPDTLLKPEDLIGMTPRRMAMAGKMLRAPEMQAPELVSRGENVTIIFKNGPLSLSASGKALQNGAKGEIIRVINIASNRSIDGVISGSREITVTE